MQGTYYAFEIFGLMQDTISSVNAPADSLPFRDTAVHGPGIIERQEDSIIIEQGFSERPELSSPGLVREKTAEESGPENAVERVREQRREPLPVKPAERSDTVVEEKWNTVDLLVRKLYSKSGVATYTDSSSNVFRTNTVENVSDRIIFKKRTADYSEWIFWTFILVSVLFIWIQVFYRKYIGALFNSTMSYQVSLKLLNEKNAITRRVSFILNFVYTLSVSLFIFLVIKYYHLIPEQTDEINAFLIILNLVIIFLVVKVILHKISGYIFNSLQIVNEYLHNVYVVNKALGIILLPLTFVSFFSLFINLRILVFTGALLILFSFLIKIIRSFQIIIKNEVLILYSILYLCTLEILPVLIGIEFLKMLI